MDWREMAGKPTIRGFNGTSYGYAWIGGKKVGLNSEEEWDGRTDPLRAWIIAICWLVACGAECAERPFVMGTLTKTFY
jgi:hypothetical protein